jgi:hypothetical protein
MFGAESSVTVTYISQPLLALPFLPQLTSQPLNNFNPLFVKTLKTSQYPHHNIHLTPIPIPLKMSSESNRKAHACGQCTRSFSRKNDLERHMNIHRSKDERPWKCSHCPRTFCQKGQRDTHHNTHTGLKPFKCSFCSKGFGDWSARHRHEKKVHGAAPQPRQKRVASQSTLQTQNGFSDEMLTAAGVDFGVALGRDALGLVETGSSEAVGWIGFQSTLQAQNSFSNELLTAAGVDFGVALDRGALGLMEAGSSEVSGATFGVSSYMQDYDHLSRLLLGR